MPRESSPRSGRQIRVSRGDGHFETPYGIYGPAVAVEAEQDVDTFGSNFFQRIGTGPGEVKPGVYYVDVWWSGGPAGVGGAIGAAFVLKLYQ